MSQEGQPPSEPNRVVTGDGVLPYATPERRKVSAGEIVGLIFGIVLGAAIIAFLGVLGFGDLYDMNRAGSLRWAALFGVILLACIGGLVALARRRPRPRRFLFLGGLIGLGATSLIEGICFLSGAVGARL